MDTIGEQRPEQVIALCREMTNTNNVFPLVNYTPDNCLQRKMNTDMQVTQMMIQLHAMVERKCHERVEALKERYVDFLKPNEERKLC